DAAASPAQYAFAVRVVHHRHDAVLFGDFDQRGERRDIAIHAEHAVADDQAAAILGGLRDFAAQVVHVIMGVGDDGRTREAAAIDDAGVVERVGEDDVSLADKAGNGGEIGGEAGL